MPSLFLGRYMAKGVAKYNCDLPFVVIVPAFVCQIGRSLNDDLLDGYHLLLLVVQPVYSDFFYHTHMDISISCICKEKSILLLVKPKVK